MENLAKKIAIVAILVAVSVTALAVWSTDQLGGDGGANDGGAVQADMKKITVLASFYPLYDFTRNIGGDRINVELLVQDGAEPHDWDPSIRDINDMQEADMIIINGLGFEGWVDNFSEINIDTKMVDASEGIVALDAGSDEHGDEEHGDEEHGDEEHGDEEHGDEEHGDEEHGDEEHGDEEHGDEEHGDEEHGDEEHGKHSSTDPHVWLNPVLVKSQVMTISNALQEIDPENSEYYKDNTASYLERLDGLDGQIRDQLSSCSADFIVYHNAFSYFADEYGLRQHAVNPSIDPHSSEPTPKGIQNIIELAKDLGIDVIFAEEGIDQRTPEVIAKEIGGRVLILSPMEIGGEDSDYVLRMEQNLANLKEALC